MDNPSNLNEQLFQSMRNKFKTFIPFLKVYGLGTALVIGWWFLAFKPNNFTPHPFSEQIFCDNTSIDVPLLSPIKRDILQEALGGNFPLMTRLMLEWDFDAQILQSQGLDHIKRMPSDQLLRSQLIGRRLKQAIPNKKKADRYLPQTFASASFLLALTSPDEIVALPKRLREQKQVYPQALTDKITLDIERYHSEKIFQEKPKVAFVAHYSHPSTLQALKNQGIQLYMMKSLNTLSDIAKEILCVGQIISRPLEAELLKLFMDAALTAIDNRLAALKLSFANNQAARRILFLNYHQSFSIPTQKTLTGQLLERIGIEEMTQALTKEKKHEWALPIPKESIIHLDPYCLIIAAENIEALENEIRRDPALNQLSAVRNNRLFFVDQDIQQSPSQYIVLAYHDLVRTLAKFL